MYHGYYFVFISTTTSLSRMVYKHVIFVSVSGLCINPIFFLKSVHLDFMELDAFRNVVHFAKYHVLVIM